MKKAIGIVGEGPTDYMMLKEIIDHITNEENTYYRLQPEANMMGEYGDGWKGVWKWCDDNAEHLNSIFEKVIPKLDILIIHMDGDVARKEECPVILPCASHPISVQAFCEHLEVCIKEWLQIQEGRKNIIITIPCDSTEAWIIAAFDDIEESEQIENPWENIIAKKKTYHNIRITGRKKRLREYENLIPRVIETWDRVKQKCETARVFDEKVRHMCDN